MNVLITGASGFVGTKLIEKLITIDEVQVIAISRNKIIEKNKKIKNYVADIMDIDALRIVFEENEIDCVIHLAAVTEHDAIVNDKINTLLTNFIGTKNLLELFNKYCEDAQFIYASSGKVYGATNEMPISETSKCNPINILGKSKYITEKLIDYCSSDKNNFLVCRIFNVYGIGQKSNFVIPTILKQICEKEIILGNIYDKRDYVYVKDLVTALIGCILSKDKFKRFDVVNIGSGKAVSVKNILETMEDLLNRKLTIRIDEKRIRKDETEVEYCSNKKLCELTGWKIKYTLKDALNEMLRKEGYK